MRPLYAIVLLFGLAACSHDTDRENPLDPELTPAVALDVQYADSTGVAQLSWTSYRGDVPLAEYRVLRKVQGIEAVDTLAVLADLGSTAFTDTTLSQGVAYLYRVSVRNAAGLIVDSPEISLAPVQLPAPRILSLDLDSATASARLTWSAYVGRGFFRYEIHRADVAQPIAIIGDIDSTEYSDDGLHGDVPYSYRVVVRTTGDDVVSGAPSTARFHAWLASWPLDLAATSAFADIIRLEGRADGGVESLHNNRRQIWLTDHGADGQVIERRQLMDLVDDQFEVRSTSTAVLADDRRVMSLFNDVGTAQGIVRFEEGRLVRDTVSLELEAPPSMRMTDQGVTLRLISKSAGSFFDVGFANVHVRDMDGRSLFHDDFSVPNKSWNLTSSSLNANDPGPVIVPGWLFLQDGGQEASLGDESWHDVGASADVYIIESGELRLDMGSSHVSLTVATSDPTYNELGSGRGSGRLAWTGVDDKGDDVSSEVSAGIDFYSPLPASVSLAFQDAGAVGAINYPSTWNHRHAEHGTVYWAALAAVGDQLAHTAGTTAFSLDADGSSTELGEFEVPVSDLRSWHLEGERLPRMATSLPEADLVLWGQIFSAGRWSSTLRQRIGPDLGDAGGELDYPVAVDAGPDGRMYVLDAGNARIVVLDKDGAYLTEFGTAGDDDGQFDFLNGSRIDGGLNYTRSIAVDDDGFIYVADVGNRRIQKFAP